MRIVLILLVTLFTLTACDDNYDSAKANPQKYCQGWCGANRTEPSCISACLKGIE